jgi:phosphate transport system protein
MERYFDVELDDLKKNIVAMGTLAQEAIYKSVEALKSRKKELATSVIDDDVNIDRLELRIDEKCIDLIARYQPWRKISASLPPA